jgi:hypothetical protein
LKEEKKSVYDTLPSDKEGYADLTSLSQPKTETQSGQDSLSSSETSSFFSSISQNQKEGTMSDSFGGQNSPPTPYLHGFSSSSSAEADFSLLKNKIDDLDYKLDSIYRKINMLSDRLELAEKKIERIEGRGS